jgi:hypothetical protein
VFPPSFEAKRTALTCVGYGLRCVRKLRLDHANRIAGLQLLTVHLTVSQMVQFAALGIAEVIVRRASPAGLMQNALPSIARGGASPTAGTIAHRA